jgi:putative spermidine/putrescine transport system substrate-binding protein
VAKNPIGGNYAVGYTLYSVGLVYRSDKIAPLTSWKDLWRPELKGRVAFPDVSTTQGPLMLQHGRCGLGRTDDYATGMPRSSASRTTS